MPRPMAVHDRSDCPICRERQKLSCRQIAAKLGMSKSAVGVHLRRSEVVARVDKRITGKDGYYAARDAGLNIDEAARAASIAISYASELELNRRAGLCGVSRDATVPKFAYDDECVRRLIAAGGFARLSEKQTPGGHIACLPLVAFAELANAA